MGSSVGISASVLDTIGKTSLVPLRNIRPRSGARVMVKLESQNPTGSMKDRMALAAINGAERDGRLGPDAHVVEYSGGSTGTALALVCAAKGYRLRIVTSDAFSQEKRDHMAALGAEMTIVPSDRLRITEALIKDMIDTAGEMSREPGAWWLDQLNNHDAATGYHAMGDEIWQQTDGAVNVFVQSVGTAHSLHGTIAALRRHRPDVRCIAVEPAESPILSTGKTGGHRIEGIGIGFVPPLWDPADADEIEAVTSADAEKMARRLAREEALFAGTSSGANVVAAMRVAERLPADATVVTVLVDSGLKYLTTEVFRGISTRDARIAERRRRDVGDGNA